MSPTDVDVQQHDPELPTGWARGQFGEIYELAYGKSLTKAARNTDGDFPVYGSNGIVGHHDTFLVEGPILVVGRKGAAGAVSFSSKPCWPIDTTYYVRDSEHIDIRFSFYLLTSLRLDQFDRSTAIPGLNRDDAYDLVVDLPPLSEQRCIVAKIEELFSELDKGVESLKTARAQLNVYRQAVLKHAFEGKLTAQWREENKDKLETAEQLLARIKKDREVRYQAEVEEWKVADRKWQEEQKNGYRPNKPRKLSNLVTIAAKKNEVTPASWLSLKIDGVCDIADGDRGPNYPKKDDYLPDGYCLFLNAKNVTKKGLVFDECQFITEIKHRSLREGSVAIGDIIFTSRGTIGNVALHSSLLDFGAIRINSGMFILRNYSPIMIGDYFTWLLMSPIITKQIKRLHSGTAQPQLPIREFKQFVISVPPIPEQEVIMRTIEAQMSSIDTIESDLARQLSSADTLRQSILKKALSGQLVPQDPHDEPASVLLDRIRAEKKEGGEE